MRTPILGGRPDSRPDAGSLPGLGSRLGVGERKDYLRTMGPSSGREELSRTVCCSGRLTNRLQERHDPGHLDPISLIRHILRFAAQLQYGPIKFNIHLFQSPPVLDKRERGPVTLVLARARPVPTSWCAEPFDSTSSLSAAHSPATMCANRCRLHRP